MPTTILRTLWILRPIATAHDLKLSPELPQSQLPLNDTLYLSKNKVFGYPKSKAGYIFSPSLAEAPNCAKSKKFAAGK